MRNNIWFPFSWLLAIGLMATSLPVSEAALTADHRKQIAEVRKEVAKVQAHITRKDFDAAREILETAKEKLGQIASDADVMETDRALAPLFRQIDQKRVLLEKKEAAAGDKGKDTQIDFDADIAPIFASKCASCHNEDRSSGGLRLDNFAGLEAGGTNRPLLVAGVPARSLLMARLTAAGNARMPKPPQEALSKQEIMAIASWIAKGAKFDGDKERLFSASPTGADKLPPPTIPKATGDEKVSFTKDIAPFMVNLCLGCHSGNNPRGGLSLVSFESMMRGGNSGRVILPGNREGSRLFRLVGGLENPRMPQGQARITRQNYEDLITWFDEGNKFDGNDPKKPLREIVPTAEELAAERLAKLTDEEFHELRKERAAEQWKLANPQETAITLESADFLAMGNVSEERLKEVLDWADQHAQTLRSAFAVDSKELWRGKLSLFVFKERFNFEEFPRVIESAEVPRETFGISKVTSNLEEAYVCLEDIGDEITEDSPGLKLSLIEQVTAAYLKRSGERVPDWLTRGLGLALVAKEDKKNTYIIAQPGKAVESLQGLETPEQVFEKGKFSSADLGPIGVTLVQFMLNAGGPQRLGQFIDRLQKGDDLNAALKTVYNTNPKALGLSYLGSLGSRKAPKARKK